MLIALSGRTASGKSTLAKALALELGCRAGSFGGYIRFRAEQLSLDAAERQVLQDLGQRLVDEDPAGFVTEFLRFSKYSPDNSITVVDGLRHLSILDELKSQIQSPDRFVLIYVEIGDADRRSRLLARGNSDAQIDSIENHPSEKDVLYGLAAASDLRVDGNLDQKRQIEIIRAKLQL